MIITRKIEIYPIGSSVEKKEHWDMLRSWQQMSYKLANYIATHRFIQDNLLQMVYLEEGIRHKLADHSKDELGILNSSSLNSTHKLSHTLTELPGDIRACINQYVSSYYSKGKNEYYTGIRSLRSYRNTFPIPFSGRCIRRLHWNKEKGNFEFKLFGIPFSTTIGADRSNNRIIIDRCLSGEYKLCGSSIQLSEKKIMLLLRVDIPPQKMALRTGNVTFACLGTYNPIVAINGRENEDISSAISRVPKSSYSIGTKDEFLYQKMRIRESLLRAKQSAQYNKGGKGYKRKMQGVKRFEDKESNYTETKVHTYSRFLVEFAKKNKSEKLILTKEIVGTTATLENSLPVFDNWNYYGLIEKIKYKAAFYGIEVIMPN
ncbi:MAG: hypothetical protein ACK5KL_16400 [Dysgonomonas sp.]